MKLRLSDFASIAEIVAAIGVIISLIFVGLQVNESSNETRAATIQAAADAESFMLVTLITHASTWDKVVVGAPLETGEENRKAILLFNLMMTENENRYRQFQSGYLDSQSWESRLSNLRSIVNMPIFESWRSSYGGKGHSTGFLTLIDELVVESQTE